MHRSQSVSYINKRFKKLFQDIYNHKKCSNEKLDARTLLDPLDKITGGVYKEVKLDNSYIPQSNIGHERRINNIIIIVKIFP